MWSRGHRSPCCVSAAGPAGDRAAGPRPVLVIETAAGEARFHPLRPRRTARGAPRGLRRSDSLVTGGAGAGSRLAAGARRTAGARRGGGPAADDDVRRSAGRTALEARRPLGAGRRAPDRPTRTPRPVEPMAGGPARPRRCRGADPCRWPRRWPSSSARVTTIAARRRRSPREAEPRAQAPRSARPRRPHGRVRRQAAHARPGPCRRARAELAARRPRARRCARTSRQLQPRQRTLERELDQSRDQLRLMTFERDELERQAQAFDERRDQGARARRRPPRPPTRRTESTLSELQVWRGELERRLAATTTELGALRAAREADERELVRLRAALERARARRYAREHGDGAGWQAADRDRGHQAEEIQRLAAELRRAALAARTRRLTARSLAGFATRSRAKKPVQTR